MLISVIVPVYKVEKYLPACVESILAQTHKDLEIILVDDGSPDGCGAMCDSYAEQDSRIRVIHKENGGLSDARNAGLAVCRGDYIGFVDSDDYIAPDMYETLAAFAEKENLDVAMCGVNRVWSDHVEESGDFLTMVLTEPDDMIYQLFVNPNNFSTPAVWCRIYRASRYKDLLFEKGRYMEDAYYTIPCIERARRFGIICDRKYYYNHRDDSITAVQERGKRTDDLIEGWERNLECIRMNYPKSISAGEYRVWMAYRMIIDWLEDWDRPYCCELAQLIRRDIFKIWRNPCVSLKSKVGYSLIAVNVGVYFRIRRIYRRLKGSNV